MKAVVITKHGAPEMLAGRGATRPAGRRRRRAVAVKAAGINFADLMARSGVYPDAPQPPCVVGYEVAGEIESVGDGVDSHAVGDRVIAGTRFGGYAELVSVPADQVIPLPELAHLRAGRRFPGQLRHRLGGAGDHGRAAKRRPRPDPRRSRRGRDRGDPDRQADRGRDLRHGVGRPSTTRSASRASITRSTTARRTSPTRRCGSPAAPAST